MQCLPLFEIFSKLEDRTNEIEFVPSRGLIQKALEDAITKGVAVICSNEMLKYKEEYTLIMSSELDEGIDLFEDDFDILHTVITDINFINTVENMKSGLLTAYDRVSEFSEVLHPYVQKYLGN
jgi:hypothetical protein